MSTAEWIRYAMWKKLVVNAIKAMSAKQVFDAFYTTKPDGIGLSISRSIVEAHGGRIWASRNEPHGTVLQLSLPAATEGQP